MIRSIPILILALFLSSCTNSQDQKRNVQLVGSCEGCEAIFEYGDKVLNAVDTLPDFDGSDRNNLQK